MKVALYCQHVLGVGHLFRSLEIAAALRGHQVAFISGGRPVEAALPDHARLVQLPGLAMDEDFGGLYPLEPEADLERVKADRTAQLLEFCASFRPDVLLVELFPFGRNPFRFELDPLLDAARAGLLGAGVRVACSVRDILVEKRDTAKYEARVVADLNRWFHLVLVHADSRLQPLDETFGRLADIRPPVVYTGFVTPGPEPGARQRLRAELRLQPDERLVVASAGGGQVGFPLLDAVLRAFARLDPQRRGRLLAFAGPHLGQEKFLELQSLAGPDATVERFHPRFPDLLAAADLSVSQAGYNTCMNILAAGVPALVQPFAQNREQRMRAEKLAGLGAVEVLPAELEPETLADILARQRPRRLGPPPVDLDGAAATARLLEELAR